MDAVGKASNDGALGWAATNGHTEVVRLLLSAGADVHAGNDYALRWAAARGRTEIVKLLRAYSDEALVDAAKSGDSGTLKRLLGGGQQPRPAGL